MQPSDTDSSNPGVASYLNKGHWESKASSQVLQD